MSDTVMAATLVAPFDIRVERYPMPTELEPGAVLVRMLASGICGTDKHTYRGETEQYAGTDHASSTPFPIIQGHENVGIVEAIGAGGTSAGSMARISRGIPTVGVDEPNCASVSFNLITSAYDGTHGAKRGATAPTPVH